MFYAAKIQLFCEINVISSQKLAHGYDFPLKIRLSQSVKERLFIFPFRGIPSGGGRESLFKKRFAFPRPATAILPHSSSPSQVENAPVARCTVAHVARDTFRRRSIAVLPTFYQVRLAQDMMRISVSFS